MTSLLVRIVGDNDDLEQTLDETPRMVDKVGSRISAAASTVGLAAGAALGAGIVESFNVEAASDKLAAQLGVDSTEAARIAEVSGDIWADGWGSSAEEVNAAIKGVYQNIGEGNDEWLRDTAQTATAVAGVFEQDVGAVTASVGQMLNTGLVQNADEAFDVITAGFQAGADKAGDFLDTINEYAPQWQKFGLDAQTATGLLSQGLRAGARDSDLVADAIKEFSIRAIDGSETTKAGFDAIGLSATDMAAKIAAGGPESAAALDLTLDRLRAIEDPVERNAAAVALFGTQAEDLGGALFALDPSSAVDALGQVGGAADRMAETVADNPAAALETFKRTAQQKLTEIGGAFVNFGMQNQQFVQPLIIALGALAAAILLVKGGMMAWTAATTAWTAIQKIATAAQWLWNAAMSANPIGLVVLAVAGLVAGIVLLYKNSETARNIINAAFNGIWTAIQFVYNWVRDNWPLLLTILTGPIGLAVSQIITHWDSIRNGISAVFGWIRDNWQLVLSILTGPIGAAVIQIVTHWDKIKSAGVAVLNWFKELPGNLTSALSSIGQIILSPFKAAFNGVARAWNNSVGKVGFSVPGWVPGLGGKSWSIPDIPLLETGGVVTRTGLALIHRNETVLPAGTAPLPRGAGGAGAAGGGAAVLELRSSGSRVDDMLLEILRSAVSSRGGNVQTVIGS
ncbi:phage tail tape measure protein [Parafrankia soli]|uniref:phage tail tape measure protein n=1 Tax=Parafrankia soli TaxID=2599596 RepID=UPI001F52A9A5|nr:phage tail tape measure protein [Parafrankia soli]